MLQCDKVCGALLNCGEHTCAQVCHSGACQPCQLQVQQSESHTAFVCCALLVLKSTDDFCFPQSATAASPPVKSRAAPIKTDLTVQDISPVRKHVRCKSVVIKARYSSTVPSAAALTLNFTPFRMLNCEAHRCQQVCHAGRCQPCPRSPSLVTTCPCSQTPLTKLLELGYSERRSCSDPVPSCGKTCNKPLACGSSGKEERDEIICRHAEAQMIYRLRGLNLDFDGSNLVPSDVIMSGVACANLKFLLRLVFMLQTGCTSCRGLWYCS